MTSNGAESGKVRPQADWLPATHWSVILAAGQSQTARAREALEQLCQAYWYPLYVFVRRKGYQVEEAQDLTQAFFAHILAGDFLKTADPAKGRFRTFLLTSLRHFLANEWDRGRSQKRGGDSLILPIDETAEFRYQKEPAHGMTPERLYERRLALTLLDRAMERLQSECLAEGKSTILEKVQTLLAGDAADFSYATAAAELRMREGTLRTAVYRLRRRYGEIVREEIARTVSTPEEVEEEVQHLFDALSP